MVGGEKAALWKVADTKKLELVKTFDSYPIQIKFSQDSKYLTLDSSIINTSDGETVLDFEKTNFADHRNGYNVFWSSAKRNTTSIGNQGWIFDRSRRQPRIIS